MHLSGACCSGRPFSFVRPARIGGLTRTRPAQGQPLDNHSAGLSSEEARRRLAQFGPNATPDVAPHPLRQVAGKFLAPVSVLLELAIVLQLGLGEYVEASIIALLLVFNAALAVILLLIV